MKSIMFFAILIASAFLGGCATTVRHGPANMPPPSSNSDVTESDTYLDEPQPVPVTQKDIPADESSLKKTGSDKQLTK